MLHVEPRQRMQETDNRLRLRLRTVTTVTAVLLVVCMFGAWRIWERNKARVGIPDEKAAAFELLAQKFVGPGYFHDHASETNRPTTNRSKFHISTTEARFQINRIVEERRLGPESTNKLTALIERLSEPSRSRVVGDPEVNLLRLNLALDEMTK